MSVLLMPGRVCVGSAVAIMCVLLGLVLMLPACGGGEQQRWHRVELSEEYHVSRADVISFADYLALEERLFRQLDEQIYAYSTSETATTALQRYSRGSAADPARWPVNWNRSFEWAVAEPRGAVLLLHGMSDSPYSLRALGEMLHRRGYHVIALRLPGHGTAPSGLRHVHWGDMAAAVGLAVTRLKDLPGDPPLHMVGYSTGAPLALDYTLRSLAGGEAPPSSLVLISPAIRIHPTSAMARFKNALSALPGLSGLAYLSVMAEFDPFKYNSFATNAAAQVHAITRDLGRQMAALAQDPSASGSLPPILVLKSTVDATVSTEAVVDHLLARVPGGGHELVLFDINRDAALAATVLIDDPAPLTDRLLARREMPFALTLITSDPAHPGVIVERHKPAFADKLSERELPGVAWPRGVVSLSHIALSFPPDDPLYGQVPAVEGGRIFLGDLAVVGERGLLNIPAEWWLRMRYNPFYDYFESRIFSWIDQFADPVEGRSERITEPR